MLSWEKLTKTMCFCKVLAPGKMVAVDKHLESAQRFLRGVRALSSYADIEQKQLRGLLTALAKCQKLSTAVWSMSCGWDDCGLTAT